jgi:hypothetical protein
MTTLEARWMMVSMLDNYQYDSVLDTENTAWMNLKKAKAAGQSIATMPIWFMAGMETMQRYTPVPFWDFKKPIMDREQEIKRFMSEALRLVCAELYQTATGSHEEKMIFSKDAVDTWMDDIDATHHMDAVIRRSRIKPNRGIISSASKLKDVLPAAA